MANSCGSGVAVENVWPAVRDGAAKTIARTAKTANAFFIT
jgi:hypothetical protein